MSSFLANLPHLIMATIVIAAVTVLAATGTISGDTALPIIAAAGGLSIGAAAATIPTLPVPPAAPASAAAPAAQP